MGIQIASDTARNIPNAIHRVFSDLAFGKGLGLG